MRNNRIGAWLRSRWLETAMVLGLVGILYWYGFVGYGFVPKPTPTPTPAPTSTPAPTPTPIVRRFTGQVAYREVTVQTDFGPRPTGSEAHAKLGEYINRRLVDRGWEVQVQEFAYKGVQARNIIGKAGKGPVVIVGAHYDTRRRADQDPDPARRTEPVLGANDGASGVAVLLELARTIEKYRLTNEVWLTFFDAEDNGNLDGWEFIAGSTYMAENLGSVTPEAVIVIDMIGDADQQLYRERTSTPELRDRVWELAASLGYAKRFLPDTKWSMTDDHTPFLRRGLPAIDIIDFDYPHWHTTHDTPDKVSAESLESVGRVLETLLERGNP